MTTIDKIYRLDGADLIVDAVYDNESPAKGKGAEIIHRLLPGISNSGGFRIASKAAKGQLIVLYSSTDHPDWPDGLDQYTGIYTYYGDNRTPGRELLDTPRGGNKALANAFELARGGPDLRKQCPIFLLFERAEAQGFSVRFRGLAIPGSADTTQVGGDLTPIWRVANNTRFQNYKAVFTVLDAGVIDGAWVRDVIAGTATVYDDLRTPKALKSWVESGRYTPLKAPIINKGRSPQEQTPNTQAGLSIIQAIRDFCSDDDYLFEVVAAEIWKLSIRENLEVELTRRFRDGGRDAIGQMYIGPKADRIALFFSLEAKHYDPSNPVGVKEVARLISRIRHKEFGVLVTTSYVSQQAYEEIRLDNHPIVIIAGQDIVEILGAVGITTPMTCQEWLQTLNDPRK